MSVPKLKMGTDNTIRPKVALRETARTMIGDSHLWANNMKNVCFDNTFWDTFTINKRKHSNKAVHEKANEGLRRCDPYRNEQKKNTDIFLKGSEDNMEVYPGTLMNNIWHLKKECNIPVKRNNAAVVIAAVKSTNKCYKGSNDANTHRNKNGMSMDHHNWSWRHVKYFERSASHQKEHYTGNDYLREQCRNTRVHGTNQVHKNDEGDENCGCEANTPCRRLKSSKKLAPEMSTSIMGAIKSEDGKKIHEANSVQRIVLRFVKFNLRRTVKTIEEIDRNVDWKDEMQIDILNCTKALGSYSYNNDCTTIVGVMWVKPVQNSANGDTIIPRMKIK